MRRTKQPHLAHSLIRWGQRAENELEILDRCGEVEQRLGLTSIHLLNDLEVLTRTKTSDHIGINTIRILSIDALVRD